MFAGSSREGLWGTISPAEGPSELMPWTGIGLIEREPENCDLETELESGTNFLKRCFLSAFGILMMGLKNPEVEKKLDLKGHYKEHAVHNL